MKGVVNLYKPRGWTSRDAVNKVRNLLGVKDVGHMGTLDPQGEGVLLIGVGKGTRLFDAFLKKIKFTRRTLLSATKPIHLTVKAKLSVVRKISLAGLR